MKDLISEQWCRELLKKEDLDYNKFYKRQIEVFLDVSRKDNKELREKIDKAIDMIDAVILDMEIKGNVFLSLNELKKTLQEKKED